MWPATARTTVLELEKVLRPSARRTRNSRMQLARLKSEAACLEPHGNQLRVDLWLCHECHFCSNEWTGPMGGEDQTCIAGVPCVLGTFHGQAWGLLGYGPSLELNLPRIHPT